MTATFEVQLTILFKCTSGKNSPKMVKSNYEVKMI